MGLFNFFRNDNKIRYELELLVEPDLEDAILALLEKRFKLPYKKSHCRVGIIGFSNILELNYFLKEFEIIFYPPQFEGKGKTISELDLHCCGIEGASWGPLCGRFVRYIRIGSLEEKDDISANLKKAVLSLYKTGHIDIFMS